MGVNTRSRKRSPKRSMVRAMRPISMRSLPMPRIMARLRAALALRGGATLIHRGAHALDGAVEPVEDRLAGEEMADTELDDGGNGGDRADPNAPEAGARLAIAATSLCLG